MYFKFTQLKDLPGSPAGTIKIVNIEPTRKAHEYPDPLLEDPEWYAKEPQIETLVELKCPKCGSTKASPYVAAYKNRDYDSDYYGINYEIALECPCGCVRRLCKHGQIDHNILYSQEED